MARQYASDEITSPPATRREGAERGQAHAVLDELDVPVEHQHVHTSRMKAPRAGHRGVAAVVGAIRILAVRRVKMVDTTP